MATRRRFLFLQGFNSPFLARLGDRLRHAGHDVFRINFSAGDAVYWLGRPAWNFRGTIAEWPDYLTEKFEAFGFTDVVLMGDTRPLHEKAIPLAQGYGARLHVLEEGYFRPNWVTLEENGVNGFSSLPKDPDWFREVARRVPQYGNGEPVGTPFRLLVAHGFGYRVPNALNPLLFPGYRHHRPRTAPVELYGWVSRFARMPYYRRRDNARIEQLVAEGAPFYLLPLQLENDSQIQTHSPFRGVPFVIKRVINSFLRYAPKDSYLVVKNHPMDTGFIDYAGMFRRLEKRLGLEGRLVYLESGHMPTLLAHARGVVTVNSTVGGSALLHNQPVIALGEAIYDMPGLTFQGPLDDFWGQGVPPDTALFRDFRNVVIHTTQINGSFYSRKGIRMASRACAERLQQDRTPWDALLAQTRGDSLVGDR